MARSTPLLPRTTGLLSLLAVGAFLVAGCGDDAATPTPDTGVPPDTSDTNEPDGSDDTGPTPDVEEDIDEDVADTDTTPDDADVDVPDVDPGDIGPDVPPRVCPEGTRNVANRCRRDFDRVCLVDTDCRAEENETCVIVGDQPLGTCIRPLADPRACPGEACPVADGDPLRAGFAARVITPIGWEFGRPGNVRDPDAYGNPRIFAGDVTDPRTFCDCGRDMICPPTEEFADCVSFGEYTGPDADGTEGDGFMQGAWIAGFANNRNAQPCPEALLPPTCTGPTCCTGPLVHDDIWARGFVMEQGGARVAIVSVDTVGFFYSDQRRIEAMLDPAWGIDTLIMTATHTHEAPDTMGRWGPGVYGSGLPTDTGVIAEHMQDIYTAVLGVIEESVTELTEVDLYAAQVNTGIDGFAVRDSRDPYVFYDLMTVMQVVRAGQDRTVAANTVGTIVNWHSHPETLGGDNVYISSDFPHYVRAYLENGFAEEATDGETVYPAYEPMGGVAVYISGTVGGLLNPLRVPAIDRDGSSYSEEVFEKTHALGARLADLAYRTFTVPCVDGERYACYQQVEGGLSFAEMEFYLDVENTQLQAAAISLGLFDRQIYNWRQADRAPIFPKVLTAAAQVRVGPVTFQTTPGEAFPETFIGGFSFDNVFDNAIVGNWQDINCGADGVTPLSEGDAPRFPCIVKASNPNPPDLAAGRLDIPLRSTIPGEYLVVIGLGMDELGYLVPEYDFKVSNSTPYLVEADGDHYEETVSVGPRGVADVRAAINRLTSILGNE